MNNKISENFMFKHEIVKEVGKKMWWKFCPFHYGSQCVELTHEKPTVTLTNINEYGIYDVDVVDFNDKKNGLKASFRIAANNHETSVKNVVKCASSNGANVDITWLKGKIHPYISLIGGNEPKVNVKVVFKKTA